MIISFSLSTLKVSEPLESSGSKYMFFYVEGNSIDKIVKYFFLFFSVQGFTFLSDKWFRKLTRVDCSALVKTGTHIYHSISSLDSDACNICASSLGNRSLLETEADFSQYF